MAKYVFYSKNIIFSYSFLSVSVSVVSNDTSRLDSSCYKLQITTVYSTIEW